MGIRLEVAEQVPYARTNPTCACLSTRGAVLALAQIMAVFRNNRDNSVMGARSWGLRSAAALEGPLTFLGVCG